MSRSGEDDYDDENFPNEGAFWRANAQRALKGKRGKAALADLRDALLLLPEKRLVNGAISTASLKVEAEAMPAEVPAWGQPEKLIPNWRKTERLEKVEREGVGVCAVGAYKMGKLMAELGWTAEEAMAALPSLSDVDGGGMWETQAFGVAAGLSSHVANIFAYKNDETFGHLTPEERYIAFLAWIDAEVTEVTV